METLGVACACTRYGIKVCPYYDLDLILKSSYQTPSIHAGSCTIGFCNVCRRFQAMRTCSSTFHFSPFCLVACFAVRSEARLYSSELGIGLPFVAFKGSAPCGTIGLAAQQRGSTCADALSLAVGWIAAVHASLAGVHLSSSAFTLRNATNSPVRRRCVAMCEYLNICVLARLRVCVYMLVYDYSCEDEGSTSFLSNARKIIRNFQHCIVVSMTVLLY